MAMHKDHELHTRRMGRNMGLLGVLLAFVALIFWLTVVKVTNGEFAEAFDHVARPQLMQETGK
jgi:cell division protein FtsI/penicillin-binding protein 2